MSITAVWNPLGVDTLRYVPQSEGVYELADISQSAIYIGRSDDLSRRLHEHLSTTDSCIQLAQFFRYELTQQSVARERQLLEEYRHRYGRYPRCNGNF